MDYLLSRYRGELSGEVRLSPSKSESNRALLIKALSGGEINLKNLSDAQDTQTMNLLLQKNRKESDVMDAGTTMRFLTAYFAVSGKNKTITGSPRMKERPIGPLVDSLRKIGSDIQYLENDGYPPLLINKYENQLTDKISIPGNISSQYISALLMVAPTLPNGLKVELTTEVFSKPYIDMTLDLMKAFGAEYKWKGNTITVEPGTYSGGDYTIEGDWSGASYWYSFVALSRSEDSHLVLPTLRTYSSQGDKRITDLMYELGVMTEFSNGRIRLTKRTPEVTELSYDMRDCPDLAQTLFVVAALQGVKITFTGLESLKIKETDRIAAMKAELNKIRADLIEEGNKWTLIPTNSLPEQVEIDTYEDHRMAMAFAPLSQKTNVVIKEPSVVRKSYPGFWEEVKKTGVHISPH